MLESGIIKQVETQPHMVNPLTVADNSTKLRLVLDLREINPHVEIDKLKFEDLNTANQFFKKGQFMSTFDLCSGYHHVDICKEHHTFLGFEWNGAFYTKPH